MWDPAEHWVAIVVVGFIWIAVEFLLALVVILTYR